MHKTLHFLLENSKNFLSQPLPQTIPPEATTLTLFITCAIWWILLNFSTVLCLLDHDEDGNVTKEEFVALPRGEVDDMMRGEESDNIWLKERQKEFEDVIDLDHDGKVGIEELKVITYLH